MAIYLFSIWDGIATISLFGMDLGRGAKQFVFLFGGDGHLPVFYLGRDGHLFVFLLGGGAGHLFVFDLGGWNGWSPI